MASFVRRAASSLLALYATTALSHVSASDLPPHARNGRLWAMIQAETQGLFSASSPELWFTQRVDHFSDANKDATFQQRFYEVNTYWKDASGPVILYIGGEGAMDTPPSGFVDTLAQRWGAKILALEHRFYGKSIPNNDLSTENYKYLTVQQALADLKHFKEQYEQHNFADKTPTPKWVAVGGSYPGALSAWFRIVYPNTTVASLSSSGVVLPVYEFTGFDEQVAESAGPKCADALRQTTTAFEDAIKQGNGTSVKALLGAQDLGDADFFYMLADAAAMAVQYGHKDIVCKAVTEAVDQKQSLPDVFAKFVIDMYGASFGSGCFYDTTCLAKDKARWAEGLRSWRWQKCSQLAYFQIAPATGSLRSSMVDLAYHVKQCKAVFGDVVDPAKGVQEIIKLYGGASPKGHNIYFANAGDDPWQRASVLETLADDEPAFLAKCDLCGHCGDLHAPNPNDPAPLKHQRQEILKYLTKWLGLENTAAIEDPPTVFATNAVMQDNAEKKSEDDYRSSPLVLVPVLLALVVVAVVVKSGVVRDRPLARRAGYVRLDAA